MKIELTVQEAQILFSLIDIAVKSAGVSVALNAAILAQKIDNAAKEEMAAESLAHTKQ